MNSGVYTSSNLEFDEGLMNILTIEDDAAVAATLREIIESWGHSVETSKSGKNALQKVTKKMFDLVLLDIFLPDINGVELIQKLKEVWPEIRIITMTGHNSRELEMEVRKQGIIYYMIKPVNTQNLKEIVDHIYKKDRKEVRKR
jgi:DNA-binding NtrC family response regulator